MQHDSALETLRAVFGYHAFRHEQAAIVDTVIDGGDALVLMPTGGGKSLCYQIPALVRPGCGIVISPLIALMQDQVDALEALGIEAAYLNSSLSASAAREVERRLEGGELQLLYLAPERLLMPATLALLERVELALFAIDEAHCVSQWGHDFRREYLGLTVLAERFARVPRIALTATADARTREEIATNLSLGQARRFVSSFDRPNIRYAIEQSTGARDRLWRWLAREHPHDAGIVYCLSRRRVDETAAWLSDKGRRALPYHAGMSSEARQANQQRFLREEGLIIVATIAFGMGIDKPDVRFVAHLNLPKSVEAYYQETGRAGRDGAPASAWMTYGLQDVINLRAMLAQSDADERHKRLEREKLDAMLSLAEMTACRRQALLAYFGETDRPACGNCDNCLAPPATWDATEAAQKALSCVYRTGQRFGVNYLVDVLTGRASERIQRFGHDRQSTFGIGEGLTVSAWRGVFRQLIATGVLAVDADGHGSVILTEAARPVLRGERRIAMRHELAGGSHGRRSRREASAPVHADDLPLWQALRGLRRRLSQEAGVPAYVVFNDSTLADMVAQKPDSLAQMADVSGVGAHKLEQYGAAFLDVIRRVRDGEYGAVEASGEARVPAPFDDA